MRSIVLLAVVAVLALLAGVAVSGLPTDVPDDVVSSDIQSSPSTTAVTTTTPATTAPPPSTEGEPTTSASTMPMTSTVALRPESALRVVVANASNLTGAAVSTADRVRFAGYADVVATNASQTRPETVVVYEAGLEAEAERLATQLGLTPTNVIARQGPALTANDEPADLWVLIGLDAG